MTIVHANFLEVWMFARGPSTVVKRSVRFLLLSALVGKPRRKRYSLENVNSILVLRVLGP